MKRLTTQEFIEKSMKLHNNKYDYSKLIFKGTKYNIKIICPEHGEFEQHANSHLQGNGCQKCHIDKLKQNSTHNTKIFIQQAKLIHTHYNYSKVKYLTSVKKVKIICKEHGEFKQTPNAHLSGQGCPTCGYCSPNKYKCGDLLTLYKNNKQLGQESGIYYELKFKHKELGFEFIKVGITSRSIKQRYIGKMYKDYEYEIINEIHCTNLESAQLEKMFMENTILEKFKFPINIKFIGYTECYKLSDLII